MKAAILQPGVAPETLRDRAGFDLVIAIDQAAGTHSADWWVVTSPEVFEATTDLGDPGTLTTLDVETAILHGPGQERYEGNPPERRKRYEPFWKQYPTSLGWSLYPTSAAMVLAASLGATEFEVFAGPTSPAREPSCVKCEKQVIDGLLKYLAAQRSPSPASIAPT